MRGDFDGHAFIPLLAEPDTARCLELLTARLRPVTGSPVLFVKPPLGGLAFMTTDGAVSAMLDAWWSQAVPAERLPVLVLLHEPGLERWVGGMDAEAVVGVADNEQLALYADLPNVRAVLDQRVEGLVDVLVETYADCFTAAVQVSSSETPFLPRHDLRSLRSPAGARPSPLPPPERPSPAPSLAPQVNSPAAAGPRAASLDLRGLIERATSMLNVNGRDWLPEELTNLALAHPTGRIVGVSSRAGGVGKTAVAAALGIIYGEAVQHSGWCAAVVDQNIGNPDQWGRLALSAAVPTVFEIMADIEAGREWTVPAWNRTPALAIYPERRDVGDAYAPAQIQRFAEELRRLHVLSVVDLPNRMPAFTSAEAAVCAGWAGVCDLMLIPTTDDPTRLQGVLDYLDAPLMRGDAAGSSRRIRVIVPYIRSPLRAVRDDPGVRSLLDQIRRRVVAVVEAPRNERATLAIVKGEPITEIDQGLRDAYVELALTVARTLKDG